MNRHDVQNGQLFHKPSNKYTQIRIARAADSQRQSVGVYWCVGSSRRTRYPVFILNGSVLSVAYII